MERTWYPALSKHPTRRSDDRAIGVQATGAREITLSRPQALGECARRDSLVFFSQESAVAALGGGGAWTGATGSRAPMAMFSTCCSLRRVLAWPYRLGQRYTATWTCEVPPRRRTIL